MLCYVNIYHTNFLWGTIKGYCIVLYCIVLYCIVLYCIVLYCIVLYCIVLYPMDGPWVCVFTSAECVTVWLVTVVSRWRQRTAAARHRRLQVPRYLPRRYPALRYPAHRYPAPQFPWPAVDQAPPVRAPPPPRWNKKVTWSLYWPWRKRADHR